MAKETKDYAKYFDFSDARVISEDERGKKIRIRGRDIQILSEPNQRKEKQRGKEDVKVLYENAVPEELKGIGVGKHYIVYTFGCQMNEHDTETIKGLLEQMGYRATEDRKVADIILLNTCAIRENAEDKVFGELGHLKSLKTEKPDLLLGDLGVALDALGLTLDLLVAQIPEGRNDGGQEKQHRDQRPQRGQAVLARG